MHLDITQTEAISADNGIEESGKLQWILQNHIWYASQADLDNGQFLRSDFPNVFAPERRKKRKIFSHIFKWIFKSWVGRSDSWVSVLTTCFMNIVLAGAG